MVQVAENLDYDQTNDILLQAELLLKSLSTVNSDSTDKSMDEQTETNHEGISGGKVTRKHSSAEIQLTNRVSCDSVVDEVKENSMNEKCNQKIETLVVNEEQTVSTGANNVEEPMDCEEPMELDDEDSEIVFNIGINRTADNSIVEVAQRKYELLENDKLEYSDKVKECTTTESVNAVEENISMLKNVDADVKCKKYDTDEVDNSELNIIAHIDVERNEEISFLKHEIESNQDSSVDIIETVQADNNTVIQKSTEVTLIDKNNAGDGCKVGEHIRTGVDSSDEEFMSADEDMDVNEVRTPLKTLHVDAIETQEPPELKQESPDRIPPKVGYNLNFDDLAAMDPFGNKKSLINSPDVGKQVPQEVAKPVVHKDDSKPEVCNSTPNDQVERGDEIPEMIEDQTEKNEQSKSVNASPCKSKLPKVEILMSPNAVLVDEVWRDKNAPNIFEEHPDCLLHDGDTQTCETGGLSQQDKSELEIRKLDFDLNRELEFNSMDPFKPNTQVVNSPNQDGTYNKLDKMDPFKQLMNTTDTTEGQLSDIMGPAEDGVVENAPIEVSEQRIADNDEKLNIAGSNGIRPQNEAVKSIDVGQPMESSPAIPITRGTYNLEALDLDEMDPFKLSKQMSNSPAVVSNEVDSFKAKNLIVGTPIMDKPTKETKQDKMEPVTCKLTTQMGTDDMSKMSDSATKNKNKQQIASHVMPVVDIVSEENVLDDIVDPFKSNTHIINSSTKEMGNLCTEDIDAFKSKSQIPNSPVDKLPNIDGNCLNSECLDIIDPFKSKSQIQNSPAIKISDNNTNLLDFGNLDGIDAFQSNSQIQNSPADKITGTSANTLESGNLMATDQFKSQSTINISPAGKDTGRKGNTLDFDSLDKIDPFQSKSQVQNSPLAKESGIERDTIGSEILSKIDQLKSPKQMQVSPASTVSKETEVNSSKINQKDAKHNDEVHTVTEKCTELFSNVDPFQAKKQLNMSPATKSDPFADLNPFNTNNKVVATPEKNGGDSENDVMGNLDHIGNIDPFNGKSKIANSPDLKTMEENNPFVMQSRVENTLVNADPFTHNTELPTTPPTEIEG